MVQEILDNMKSLLQSQRVFLRKYLASASRFKPGTNIEICYDSMLKVLSKELTLVLSDIRELDRVPSTK